MIFITKLTSVAAKLSPIAQCAVCPKQLKLQKIKAKKEHIENYFSVSLLWYMWKRQPKSYSLFDRKILFITIIDLL